MSQIVTVFIQVVAVIFVFVVGIFAWVSYREKEIRATRLSIVLVLIGGCIFLGLSVAPAPIPTITFGLLMGTFILLVILFLLPIGNLEAGRDTPSLRFDERQIMFARSRLKPGSDEYQAYYTQHPEHEVEDNLTRAQPGLLSPESKLANPFQFASVSASFFLTESLEAAVDGPVAEVNHTLKPVEMTAYVRDLARYYGADQVGVTHLEPYHVYSHVGRGAGVYGESIPVEGRYAIAFTVEMDSEMVRTAPYPPTSMETGKQYVEAGRIAVQLAAAIRALGHPARAHIDGNYRVIAPLVARDAGLGEIGRMTILMTPRQGPRVRLGVVTTDLELVPSERRPDLALLDFCNICEKCARSCPSQSIPYGPRQEVDGATRWKLNPDTCFRYWNTSGTDCARCMAVCPFAHPNTFSHNFIRWGIARSGFFRRAALWMDDLFYGLKPTSKKPPDWVDHP